MPQLPLSYKSPLEAVFLRMLAWEINVAKEKLSVQDVVTEQVQEARMELGLTPFQGGAAHNFIQNLRKEPRPLLSASGTLPRPLEPAWPNEWRLLYLPPHNLVRQLSGKPIHEDCSPASEALIYRRLKVTLRNPTLSTLDVFVGTHKPPSRTFNSHRGLYFLRLAESLYIGKTDEFDIRLSQHWNYYQQHGNSVLWWVFISPEHSVHTFTLDALAAAEALLISFWNEVSLVQNQKRGSDQKPALPYLQQGILLMEAASAVLIWLTRDKKDLGLPSQEIPFKQWSSPQWPQCYEKLPSKV